MVQAVQNVVMEFAPGHKSLDEHGPGKSGEVTSSWKKEMQERVEALEEFNKSRFGVGADRKVKQEERSLQTEATPKSNKRQTPRSEDQKDVKRSRF